MTSSLVGSEMCIRDSGVGLLPMGDFQRRGLCCTARFDSLLALQSRLPVSYTHLTLPTICSV
eukprot:9720330-Prorocentrum_lima.AAC.1